MIMHSGSFESPKPFIPICTLLKNSILLLLRYIIKAQSNPISIVLTLEYLINLIRLLILWQFSIHYALIPYHTFIDYGPISIEYGESNQEILFMSLKKISLSKDLKRYIIFIETKGIYSKTIDKIEE